MGRCSTQSCGRLSICLQVEQDKLRPRFLTSHRKCIVHLQRLHSWCGSIEEGKSDVTRYPRELSGEWSVFGTLFLVHNGTTYVFLHSSPICHEHRVDASPIALHHWSSAHHILLVRSHHGILRRCGIIHLRRWLHLRQNSQRMTCRQRSCALFDDSLVIIPHSIVGHSCSYSMTWATHPGSRMTELGRSKLVSRSCSLKISQESSM